MIVNDREWKFLAEQTEMSAPFNDMYFNYLRGLGYTGTLQDMIAAYGYGFTPSKGVGVPDWLTSLNPDANWGIETITGGRAYRTELSCVRASNGYGIQVDGTYVNFANNLARITDRGLLIEPAATNLHPSFAASSDWTTTAGASQSVEDYDFMGLFDEALAVASGGTVNARSTGLGFLVEEDATYALTYWYAAGTSNRVRLAVNEQGVAGYSDLRGSANSPGAGSSTKGDLTLVSTEPVADGFIVLALWVPNFSGNGAMGIGPDSTNTGETVLALGGQAEAGDKHTSPIVTTVSAATRAADAITLTLPSGSFDATIIFDDDTTQTIAEVSDGWTLPTDLDRRVVKAIYGVLA